MNAEYTCLECGAVMNEDVGPRRYGGSIGVIIEGVLVRRCPACGEEEVVYRNFDQLHEAIAHSIALGPARLNPGEIRFLRKFLGLTGTRLATALGVTPETVSRWENEDGTQSMGQSAERLLRMIVLGSVDINTLSRIGTEPQSGADRMLRLRFSETHDRWVLVGTPESPSVGTYGFETPGVMVIETY